MTFKEQKINCKKKTYKKLKKKDGYLEDRIVKMNDFGYCNHKDVVVYTTLCKSFNCPLRRK